VWIYHIISICSLVGGHLGCFYFLASINNAAVDVSKQIFGASPSPAVYESSSFPTLLPALLKCLPRYHGHPRGYEMVSSGFDLHFPDDS
jgi:hypothetical protein